MGRAGRQTINVLPGISDGSRGVAGSRKVVSGGPAVSFLPLAHQQTRQAPSPIPTDRRYLSRLTEEILYWQEGEMRDWDIDGLSPDGEPSGIFLEAQNGPPIKGPLFRCHSPQEELEGIYSWSEGLETPLSFALGGVVIKDENGNRRVESLKRRSRPTGEGENYAPDDTLDFSFLKEGETVTLYLLRASGVRHGINIEERLEEVRGAWIEEHLRKLQSDIRSQEEVVLLESESYDSKEVRLQIVELLEGQMSASNLQRLGVSVDMTTEKLYALVQGLGGEPLRIWNEYEKECREDASRWLHIWSENGWEQEREIIAGSQGVEDAQAIQIEISGGVMSFSELVSITKKAIAKN